MPSRVQLPLWKGFDTDIRYIKELYMVERRRGTDEPEDPKPEAAQAQQTAQVQQPGAELRPPETAKTAATQSVEKLIVAIEQELAKRESSDALARTYSALDQFKVAHRQLEAEK